jgi:hypothetical protein
MMNMVIRYLKAQRIQKIHYNTFLTRKRVKEWQEAIVKINRAREANKVMKFMNPVMSQKI